MNKIADLSKEFHPWPKEKSLYRVKKENPKRNVKLIKEFKKRYPWCMICRRKSEPHHIISKGAGGSDDWNNLWPLCRIHHNEHNTVGTKRFRQKYGSLIVEWEKRRKTK